MKNMQKMINQRVLIAILLSLSLMGCKKLGFGGSSKNTSSATGWEINQKEGGFQYNTKYKDQKTPPGTVLVEGGTFTMGNTQDDVMHDWNNQPNQQHVQSFYMDETEVTNKSYAEYLDWIERVYPPSDPKFKLIYDGALPDTLCWRSQLGYNETMVNNYLRHPGYGEYPVVGVSWIQAVEFAGWRTDRVNELFLEDAGYLKKDGRITDVSSESTFSTETYINVPTKAYGGNDDVLRGGKRKIPTNAAGEEMNVYAGRESGVISPEYRLPTEAEWEFAAKGSDEIREGNSIRGRKKYPWSGEGNQYVRTGKRSKKGDLLANFKPGKGDYGGIAGWSDDNADITNAVKSYPPNSNGLYDMSGNVAEWVADVYRPIVDGEYSDFNYYRGNVYFKKAIGEDGIARVITQDSIVYDTLSTGKVIPRNLPGEIAQIPVDENETYLRTNFSKSDHRNFRDGDNRSSRYFGDSFEEGDSINNEDQTRKMYNAPKHRVELDSLGNVIREYDKTNERTSLVNDSQRVFKGGSWRDRAYWIDPAARRHYPQEMATSYIGFRCAVSKIGSKSKKKKKR